MSHLIISSILTAQLRDTIATRNDCQLFVLREQYTNVKFLHRTAEPPCSFLYKAVIHCFVLNVYLYS
jgi:hypothetical protein